MYRNYGPGSEFISEGLHLVLVRKDTHGSLYGLSDEIMRDTTDKEIQEKIQRLSHALDNAKREPIDWKALTAKL